jgi:hypothetical protein
MIHVGRRSGVAEKDLEQEILDTIIYYGKSGIPKKVLLEIVKADQSTIYRITRKLELEDKIKTVRQGQRTTYYMNTDNVYIDSTIGASIVNRKYVANIIGQKGIVLANNYQAYPEHIDYATYTKYFQPKFSKESKFEEALFEFSNQIGAYITYLFILLSDPRNEIIFPYSHKKGNVNNLMNRSELIDEWLRNAISSGLSGMLTKFWFKFLKNVGLKEKAVVVNARPFWNYELDKDSIKILLAAFSRLYPRINHELNGIFDNLPRSIESRKEFVSELEEWYKQQESCEHEWGKPNKKSHVKQCVKCKYVQKI